MQSGRTGVAMKWALPRLLVLFAAGVALRVVSLNTRSFWLDETTAVRQATWSIPRMLAWMSNNVHPPLFHTLLHYWIVAFGSSEVAVRSFALAWGIAAIPLAYWAGSVVYDRRVGVFSAGLLSLAPFFIWYSQEARMYTMMLVFALVSIGALWHAIQSNRAGWWAVYAIAITAGVMTQYFFAFLVASQAAYVWFGYVPSRLTYARTAGTSRFQWTRPWTLASDAPAVVGWIASILVVAVPLAWWVPQVLRHRELLRGVSGPFNYGWSPPTFGMHFNEQILVPVEWLFGFHSTMTMRNLVAMWPLLITAAFVIGGLSRRARSNTTYLLVTGFGGAAAISLLGFWQPILEARYFTAVGAPIVLLAGRLLAGLRPRAVSVVTACALVISAVAWIDQSYNPSSIVKWDNRAAMGIVADGYRDGDAVLLIPYFVSSITQYYLPPEIYARVEKVPSFDRFGKVRNTPSQLAEDLRRQVGLSRRVWVIATWQETPRIALDRKNTGEWLTEHGYRQVSDHRLRQIRVSLYEGTPDQEFFEPGGQTP